MRLPGFLVACLLCACAETSGPPLVASDVEITRAAPGMKMSAGYMTLTNNSGEAIVITSISSPQFGVVEMHETVVEDDVARMRKLDELTIAAGESVVLERGGKHLMLMQPAGLSRDITLHVQSGDAVLLSIATHLAGK
ncbi:MAG: copper chaperone PCu(A)C [Woeseiaceae bacterium]|nr:copper chaperone PCu(A)C [Woeseiaceae bacterium]